MGKGSAASSPNQNNQSPAARRGFALRRYLKMRSTYADLEPKLDAIADKCRPQLFLGFASTARDFISIASSLCRFEDEWEFEKAFSRLVGLFVQFHASLHQAFDMGLLVSVDETTRPSSRELRELDRALEHPDRRFWCLITVSQLAQATACLIGTRRFPAYAPPWPIMFHLLFDEPALAGIFQGVDLAKWVPLRGDAEERFARMAESAGFQRIGIRSSCEALFYEAGELWFDSLTRGIDAEKVKECAGRMGRLVVFLTLPAQERWILQEFRAIGPTDSLQSVLQEIMRHDVRVASDSDGLDLEKLGQYARGLDGMPADVLLLTHGWIKKHKYVVSLPDFQYFIPQLSAAAFEEARSNPVDFLRRHWKDAPKSVVVQHRQRWRTKIDSAAVDAKFRGTMEHVLANLAGEAFAYAVSSSVGTSPEASIFIAGCFGIAVDVMMTLKKS